MTDAPTLTRQPETEKAEEPPKRWRNRWLWKTSGTSSICRTCGSGHYRAEGDEFAECCQRYPTEADANEAAQRVLARQGGADIISYLGAFPVSP